MAHHRPNSRNLEARRETPVNRHPHRANPLEQGDDERNRTQHGKREQRQKPRDQTERRNRLVNRVDISPDERRTSETSRRNQATRALKHVHHHSAHHSDHCRKKASRIQRPIGVLEDSLGKRSVHAPRHIARPSPQIARDHNPTEHGNEAQKRQKENARHPMRRLGDVAPRRLEIPSLHRLLLSLSVPL